MNEATKSTRLSRLSNHISVRLLVLASLLLLAFFWGIGTFTRTSLNQTASENPESKGRYGCQSETERDFTESDDRLSEATSEIGLNFQHFVGPLGTYFMPESIGAGGAFADFNGDGRLDLYLVNSGLSPKSTRSVQESISVVNRLYLQDPDGRLIDATERSGAGDRGYGVSCAAGDVDNDGDIDLYITNYGADQLYLNRGDATFENATAQAGIDQAGWGTCVSFVDYNRDGWLDIFVANYTHDPDTDHSVACGFRDGLVSYCGPHKFHPTIDRLLRNDGIVSAEGGQQSVRFTDVTESAGLDLAPTYGFGVVCFDANSDGWADLFVANDGEPNRLWLNQMDGSFKEEAVLYGVAVNRNGASEAGMGVTIGDYDRQAGFDLLLSHLSQESSTLYLNNESLYYSDATPDCGLDRLSWRHTGWGIALIDLNHDGTLDVPVANGLVVPCHSGFPFHGEDRFQKREDLIEDANEYWLDYADSNQLLMAQADGTLIDAAELGGKFTGTLESSRALIAGDYDNDGDLDFVVTNCGGKARFFRNDLKKHGDWLQIRVYDPRLKREAFGADVTVVVGDNRFRELVSPQEGYLASHDSRLHFGLGSAGTYDAIEIRWPDGPVDQAWEVFPGGKTNRLITIERGNGDGAE